MLGSIASPLPMRWILPLLLAATAPMAAAQSHNMMASGGAFSGALGAPGEVDSWYFQGLAGANLNFSVQRNGKNSALFTIELQNLATGSAIAPSSAWSGNGSAAAKIAKLTLPTTGLYRIRIAGAGGSTGSYKGKITFTTPSSALKINTTVTLAAGATASIPFSALDGATLSGSILRTKGSAALPTPLDLETSAGAVSLAPYSKSVAGGFKLTQVPFAALGPASLRIRNDGAAGSIQAALSLKLKKAPGGTLVEGSGGVFAGFLQVKSAPPATSPINADAITLEVLAEEFSEVHSVTPAGVAGVRNGASFFLYRIPLAPGANVLELSGSGPAGSVTRKLSIQNSLQPKRAVALTPAPALGYQLPFPTNLAVTLSPQTAAAVAAHIDLDGDGLIDETRAFANPLPVTFTQMGSYKPRVTIETPEGWLFTNEPAATETIKILSAPAASGAGGFAAAGTDVRDLEADGGSGERFALTASSVLRFEASGTLAQTIPLVGSAASGLALDLDGNLYVADSAANHVTRYRRQSGYSLDLTFAQSGYLSEGIEAPRDVATIRSNADGKIHILVADGAHQRVAQFALDGTLELEVKAGPGQPPLLPLSLQGRPGGGAAIVDGSAPRLLLVDSDGKPTSSTPLVGSPSAIGMLTRDSASGDLLLGVSQFGAVSRFRKNGTLRTTIPLGAVAPIAALLGESSIGAPEALVALTGSGLQQYPLPADGPTEQPTQVVALLRSALAAGDWTAVAERTTPQLHSALLEASQAPQGLASLLNTIAALGPGQITHLREPSCRVQLPPTMPGQLPMTLQLLRDPASGRWRVTSF